MNYIITEQQLEKIINETLTEDIFILRRKVEVISKIIENFDSLDCSRPQIESYQRVYCKQFKDIDFEKIKRLRSHYTNQLELLIRKEINNAKSSSKI